MMMWTGGLWLALPLMIIYVAMMAHMMGHGHGHAHDHTAQQPRTDDAEQVLAQRLARGEIDIDDYERLVVALRSARERGPSGEVGRVS